MARRLLHVGCGGDPRPEWAKDYEETRLDIDPGAKPDVVADMADMGEIGEYDAVYCSHALEHLYPHDVAAALLEFRRVLKPGGFAMVLVPDLQDVQATEDVILEAPCGPISGLDMIYGKRDALKDRPYMAHRTGFVRDTLETVLAKAGFSKVEARRLSNYNLIGVAVK